MHVAPPHVDHREDTLHAEWVAACEYTPLRGRGGRDRERESEKEGGERGRGKGRGREGRERGR